MFVLPVGSLQVCVIPDHHLSNACWDCLEKNFAVVMLLELNVSRLCSGKGEGRSGGWVLEVVGLTHDNMAQLKETDRKSQQSSHFVLTEVAN